jgi:uncharacterized integral membrane protein
MEEPVVGAGPESSSPGRRRHPVGPRAIGVLVVVGVIVVLVVQNSQRVAIRFLFITGHVRLIWVILGCVVVAGGLGYLTGRRGGGRRGRRRRPD